MKSYLLAVKNIKNPIIGKIITEAYSGGEIQDSYIFIFHDNDKKRSGVFTSRDSFFENDVSNPVAFIRKDKVFSVGDIFLLEPTGICTVLIETKSYSNALLVTEQCNSRCIFCPQPLHSDTHDLFNQSLQILSLMDQDAKVLGITGGEPTVAWTELIQILKECQSKIPEAFIHLLTNARLLKSQEKVKQLKDSNNKLLVCAPIYSDIDTIHDKMVSAKGAYWETIQGLYNLAKEEISIELRTVITKINFSRLPLFAEFIYCNFHLLITSPSWGWNLLGWHWKTLKSFGLTR